MSRLASRRRIPLWLALATGWLLLRHGRRNRAGAKVLQYPADDSIRMEEASVKGEPEAGPAGSSPTASDPSTGAAAAAMPASCALVPALQRSGLRVAPRWALLVAAIVVVDAAAIGVWHARQAPRITAAIEVGEIPAAVRAAQVAGNEPGPPPSSIEIPRIGVRSKLVDLRLLSDRSIASPSDPAKVGWWSEGVAPGDPGPAVLVGHVDSYHGPGVFLHLRDLRPGDAVAIHRNDGTDVAFVVDAVREFSKASFPSDVVYGPTSEPTLRLITCGGRFDRRARHYSDNVVVFAHVADKGPLA